MGQEDAFEVPRDVFVDRIKSGLGALLVLVPLLLACATERADAFLIVMPFTVAGALIMVAMRPILENAREARAMGERSPPLLCITDDGVWFGGGGIVPWREITTIREVRLRGDESGNGAWPRKLQITFRHRRALLATRWPLWFTALPLGRVTARLGETHGPSARVMAQLDAMRARAYDRDGGDEYPIAKPPVARVVRR